MLTIGSLFSGVGGLDLGLEWAGLGPVLWQVERDPYCREGFPVEEEMSFVAWAHPSREEWDSWVLTLRTDDAVSVYYTTGDHIYDARVRVTKTGKVYLVSYLNGDGVRDTRRNWRHYRVNVVGGGERRIYKLRKQ